MTNSTTTINERILQLIQALNSNKNAFAVRIGVDPTVIHNIVSGRKNKPSFDVLEKILLTFDNINLEWFILGKGTDIFKRQYAENDSQGNKVEDPSGIYNKERSETEKRLREELKIAQGKIDILLEAFKALGKDPFDSK